MNDINIKLAEYQSVLLGTLLVNWSDGTTSTYNATDMGVEQHIMAKANIRLLLSLFHLFRHIIPVITLFPSHYSYELSVQLRTALSFQYKKGYVSA